MKTVTRFLFAISILFICMNITGQTRNMRTYPNQAIFAEFFYRNMYYPLIDFINRVEGTTTYQLNIDNIGIIKDIKLINSSGSTTLDLEARRLIYNIPMKFLGHDTLYNIYVDFKISDNKIYKMTEIDLKPEFPGGEAEILKFISKNLNDAPESKDKGIQGMVIFGLVIEKDGMISIIDIIRPLEQYTDAEVIRVIRRMPPWAPAKKNGRPVRSYFIFPVRIGH